MPLEVYSYRLVTKWRTKKAWNRFHFVLDNNANLPAFAAAQAINFNLNVGTLFLSLFAQMVSDDAGITDTICARVKPNGGPASRVHIGGGGLQGLYLGPIADTFLTAPIRWIGFNGGVSRTINRIGFIGQGATNGDGWWPVFSLAASTFIADALTPRVLPSGDTFNLTILHSDGFSESALWGDLGRPTSRQITRRWVP
jgi:hypothetical protein